MRKNESKWNEQTNRGGEIGEFLSKKGKREKWKKRESENKENERKEKRERNVDITQNFLIF